MGAGLGGTMLVAAPRHVAVEFSWGGDHVTTQYHTVEVAAALELLKTECTAAGDNALVRLSYELNCQIMSKLEHAYLFA